MKTSFTVSECSLISGMPIRAIEECIGNKLITVQECQIVPGGIPLKVIELTSLFGIMACARYKEEGFPATYIYGLMRMLGRVSHSDLEYSLNNGYTYPIPDVWLMNRVNEHGTEIDTWVQ